MNIEVVIFNLADEAIVSDAVTPLPRIVPPQRFTVAAGIWGFHQIFINPVAYHALGITIEFSELSFEPVGYPELIFHRSSSFLNSSHE